MNRSHPKLPDETIIKEQDDKVLFLVPSKPDWVMTNRNGAIALSLCNGERTFDDIKTILAEHPDSDDAVKLIETLVTEGFFDHKKVTPTDKTKTMLRSVHLNISPLCNLQCDYCYAEERENQSVQSLSLAEYCRLIDELHNISTGIEIAITGGEPLLNEDACAISTYCRSKGFYTHLLTNGTPIDENNVEKITSSFDIIRVSVDGYTTEKHDFHRGAGSLAKTVKSIELLEKAGATVKIAMTVTKQNIVEIESMASRYGNKLIFQPLFNAGSAKGSDLAITGEEYFYALKSAKGVEPYGQIGQMLLKLKNRGTTKCAIGDVEISVSHDGDVYPCHMLHLPEYKSGNIRQQSISDIYQNSSVLNDVRKLNVLTRENCRECPVRLLCGGSCRARAFYLSGDLDAADSFCEYEFLAFTEGLLQSMELKSINDPNCSDCYGCI